jgi:hypothetical protein
VNAIQIGQTRSRQQFEAQAHVTHRHAPAQMQGLCHWVLGWADSQAIDGADALDVAVVVWHLCMAVTATVPVSCHRSVHASTHPLLHDTRNNVLEPLVVRCEALEAVLDDLGGPTVDLGGDPGACSECDLQGILDYSLNIINDELELRSRPSNNHKAVSNGLRANRRKTPRHSEEPRLARMDQAWDGKRGIAN